MQRSSYCRFEYFERPRKPQALVVTRSGKNSPPPPNKSITAQRDMLVVFVRALLCSIYKGSYALIGDKLGSLLWHLYRRCPRGLFEDKCLSAFMTELSKASVSTGGRSVDRTHGQRVLEHHRRVFGAHHLQPGNGQGPLDMTTFATAVSDLVNDCRFLCSG